MGSCKLSEGKIAKLLSYSKQSSIVVKEERKESSKSSFS
jgi:hypothetical protein